MGFDFAECWRNKSSRNRFGHQSRLVGTSLLAALWWNGHLDSVEVGDMADMDFLLKVGAYKMPT